MTTIVRKMLLKRRSDPEPTECMVEIEFDPEVLADELGTRAFCNKSKKTVEVGGIIKCTVRCTRDRAAD